jgi:hypothetical protein
MKFRAVKEFERKDADDDCSRKFLVIPAFTKRGRVFPRQLPLILTLVFAVVRFPFFFFRRFIGGDLFRNSRVLRRKRLAAASGTSALIFAVVSFPPFTNIRV